jgi:hypothetical protein
VAIAVLPAVGRLRVKIFLPLALEIFHFSGYSIIDDSVAFSPWGIWKAASMLFVSLTRPKGSTWGDVTSSLRIKGTHPFHPWILLILSAYRVSLITVGIYFVVSTVSDAQNRHPPQPQHDFLSASSKLVGILYKIVE